MTGMRRACASRETPALTARSSVAAAARYMAPALRAPVATQPSGGDQSFRDSDEEAMIVFDASGAITGARIV